jgi:uncharacterized protein YkwD
MPAFRRLVCSSLVAVLALVVAGCGAGSFVDDITSGGNPSPGPGSGGAAAMSPGEQAFADEVLRLVNVERISRGLAPLLWDDGAARAAFAHSVDMAQRGYFSHTSPEGQDTGDRLVAADAGSWSAWGENIAQGQPTPARVMSDWMGSQGHRENILRSYFTHLGVGVHAPNSVWWTQVFLRR